MYDIRVYNNTHYTKGLDGRAVAHIYSHYSSMCVVCINCIVQYLYYTVSTTESVYNGHMSVRTRPWSNGRYFPGLMNHRTLLLMFFVEDTPLYVPCFRQKLNNVKNKVWRKAFTRYTVLKQTLQQCYALSLACCKKCIFKTVPDIGHFNIRKSVTCFVW